MNAFTTHPSVRIKGTETNYEPVQCMAPHCPNKTPHMHCPFCTKTESFVDPVILKAHYRVKHVDKGIEFAGLKILRCCDHCDIVGTIKGVKEFKGAHWHCYKCKNGFNRRDEAIKHYRTHFRNPQTTFQIQITQEINQMYPLGHEVETATETLSQEELRTVHPVLTEAVMTATGTETLVSSHQAEHALANGKPSDGEVHVSVAANETVGTSDGQTIMIIHDENLDTSQEVQQENCTFQITNASGTLQLTQLGQAQTAGVNERLLELQQRNEQLEMEKAQLEQEVEQLKIQVQMQSQEISAYQKREQELLTQLSIPLDSRVHDLLNQLKSDHEDLLHQQLALLRRTYLSQLEQTENGAVQPGGILLMSNTKVTGQETESETDTGAKIVTVKPNGQLVMTDVGAGDTGASSDITTTCEEGKDDVTTSSCRDLVTDHEPVTLSSEHFDHLEVTEVEEHETITITPDSEEPPAKRKKDSD